MAVRKRGQGVVPVIPWLANILDGYIEAFRPKKYLFDELKRGPAALDYLTREMIKPALTKAQASWEGSHAFRRGLATNLHRLGVPDIVIQGDSPSQRSRGDAQRVNPIRGG